MRWSTTGHQKSCFPKKTTSWSSSLGIKRYVFSKNDQLIQFTECQKTGFSRTTTRWSSLLAIKSRAFSKNNQLVQPAGHQKLCFLEDRCLLAEKKNWQRPRQPRKPLTTSVPDVFPIMLLSILHSSTDVPCSSLNQSMESSKHALNLFIDCIRIA